MENDDEGKFLVIGSHNIAEIFETLRKSMREAEIKKVFQVIERGDFSKIFRCQVCGAGMLTQPMGMMLGENGPEYLCEDHVEKLF